jgi:hypothetical protein
VSLIKKLKEALFPADPEPGAPPSWIDRLQAAKYVSLSGVTVPFDYVDLTVLFGKKTAIFENVNADGVYVQDNGVSGARFPMLCYFSGDAHDVQAATMLKALLERGEGTLYHPIFGRVVVVPTGEIEYTSALVSAANQTSFMVEFAETTGLLAGDVVAFDSLMEAFQSAAAADFADKLNVADVADEVSFKEKFTRGITKVSKGIGAVQGLTESAQNSLADMSDSINRTIDVLVGQPLTLARQTQMLILEPGRIARATRARLEAYIGLAEDIFGLKAAPTGYDYSGENGFHGDNLLASSIVAGSALTAAEGDFDHAADYFHAAQSLTDLLDDYSTWKDDAYTTIGQGTPETADTGDGWLDLLAVVQAAVAELVRQSFDADTAVKITLDRDRGMQELVFELYGTASHDMIEKFAKDNALGGDEYFILQKGREVVYYA